MTRRLFKGRLLYNRYTLQANVGDGGFGSVWSAYDEATKKVVAIKFITKEPDMKNEKYLQILKEVCIQKILNHENICTLYDFREDNSFFIIVMEYIDGIDLCEIIENKSKLTEKEAQSIFSQLVDVLLYMHTNNIVHGDIKPENIIVTGKSLKIKIIDFGFASFCDEDTFKNALCGTNKYDSPQTAQDLHYNAHRLDVWWLGCTLYFMLHGLNFDKNDVDLPFYKFIQRNGLVLRPKLKIGIKNLLKKMLNFDQNERPTLKKISQHKWVQKKTKSTTKKLKTDNINTEILNNLKDEEKISEILEEQLKNGNNIRDILLDCKPLIPLSIKSAVIRGVKRKYNLNFYKL